MTRSATTGLNTRVSNSFSEPVVGTTISPTDADTYFDDIDSAMNAFIGTSTSSVAIGVGSKTLTIASDIASKAFLVGVEVKAFSLADSANYIFGPVTSYSRSTGALVINSVAIGGSGTINDWVVIMSGARGGAGPIAGWRQSYSSTTTDADPGAGAFRLNHATPASATEAYFDNVDTGSVSLTTILDRIDDHGNSSGRGILRAEKESDSSVWGEWLASGSVVDGTGYRKVTLSGGSGSGAFTASDVFRWAFTPKGDNGAIGGSTGASDNRLIRSDGTGGATVQSSGITIDDSDIISGGSFANTALKVRDTNASHSLAIVPGSDLTADRTLTVTTGDANRTLTLSADVTMTGSPVEQGRHTIWIPAGAMTPRTTNGAATGLVEMGTNKNMFRTLDFDTSTQEFAQFEIHMPKSWNLGTVTFQPVMSHASGSGNIVWGLAGVARSDDDAGDVAFGTAQTSDKTIGTANDIYIGPESSAITIAGTPTAGDTVQFQINRTVASDNLGVDARLHGIRLFYTVNAATDT